MKKATIIILAAAIVLYIPLTLLGTLCYVACANGISDRAAAVRFESDNDQSVVTTAEQPTDTSTVATSSKPAPIETEKTEVLSDGSKVVSHFDKTGKILSKTGFDSSGNMTYEKEYYSPGKISKETTYKNGAVTTTTNNYDASGNMTDGFKTVKYSTGEKEEHILNAYGKEINSKYYDQNGKLTLTREHHFKNGARDGYTETDKNGNKVRFNEDGSVRKAATTTAATTTKATTTTEATTTKVTTTAATTTAKPEPGPDDLVTETQKVGSDTVVKYYKLSSSGSKILSNTITYRTINGKELKITDVDEIRGYGRQNEYDGNGNLMKYVTFNVEYGRRVLENHFDANGVFQKSMRYKYNSDGKKIEESTYDASDKLTGFVTYEYLKSPSGAKTKITTYDANGKVIRTVTRAS
ncbi:MAG: hypothetical protein E7598_07550 [Ruminococcaceae bacterium]|nr:hypothetical protein [Oscillospiraceae bacterium]